MTLLSLAQALDNFSYLMSSFRSKSCTKGRSWVWPKCVSWTTRTALVTTATGHDAHSHHPIPLRSMLADLIEKRGRGIIDLLDEECRLPRASNEHFTAAVHHRLGGHFRLVVPRRSKLSQHRSLRDEEGFLIRHFAGAVCYRTVSRNQRSSDTSRKPA